MPIYSVADRETHDLLGEVLRASHADLVEAGVTIGLLFAHTKPDANGEVKGPTLKLHGYPALAIVKINSLKDRVEGKPDATIELDGDQYGEWPDARKRAVLDHECVHLLLQREKDGSVKLDDVGRPKLKMRPHDHQMGTFFEIVERHGLASVEAESYRELHHKMTQLKFPWG